MRVGDVLEAIRQQGLYRSLTVERQLHDFASNDYLGFSQSSVIRRRLVEAIDSGCPLGATGSRLLTGQTVYHETVEENLAKIFAVPAVLSLSSGYLANLTITAALGIESAEFFSDEFNHASVIDGIRLTKSHRTIFRHNDLEDLRSKLECSHSPIKVIMTESVFSQEGDLAPLAELVTLAENHDAWLVVDEAHATGVWGSGGLGRLADFKYHERLIGLHTCGKALGGQGAFITCSQNIRSLIINRARSFIFTTALAPLSVLQIQYAVEEVMSAVSDRQQLHQNIKTFSDILSLAPSHIVPLVLGSNEKVVKAQLLLQARWFDVRAIRSPTVRKGTERLRVTLKSFHDETVIRSLASHVAKVRGYA